MINAVELSDYGRAIELMDQLPVANRDAQIYDETVRRRDRIQELRNKIEVAVKEMELSNLDLAVVELLELTPNDQDLKSLMDQLPRGNGGRLIAGQLTAMYNLPAFQPGLSESARQQKPKSKQIECSVDQYNSSAPSFFVQLYKYLFD